MAARAEKRGDVSRGLRTKRGGQDLERVRFENKIELAAPRRGRMRQIGGLIVHSGMGEALSGIANGGLGNVEPGSAKTPPGVLRGGGAEPAASDQRGFSGGLLPILHPETDEMRRGMVVRPRDSALPFLGFAVENVKPSGGIVLAAELGGKFTSPLPILHMAQ